MTALWRAGYVELRGSEGNNTNWPIVNAFEYIRQFIPPHITLDKFVPNISQVIRRLDL